MKTKTQEILGILKTYIDKTVLIECEYGTVKGKLTKNGKLFMIKKVNINFYFLPYQISKVSITSNKNLKIDLK